jgi:hypothetical protein
MKTSEYKLIKLTNPKEVGVTSASIEIVSEDSGALHVNKAEQTQTHIVHNEKLGKQRFKRLFDLDGIAKWSDEIDEASELVKNNKTSDMAKETTKTTKNKKEPETKKEVVKKQENKITHEKVDAKINQTTQSDLFSSSSELNFESFEIKEDLPFEEPDKKEIKPSKKSENKLEEIVSESVQPVKVDNSTGMKEFSKKAIELMSTSVLIKSIGDDKQNEDAREAGKKLSKLKKEIDDCRLLINKPLRDAITANDNLAKSISNPIDEEINRLKNSISKYETAKEEKRKAELAKAEAEKREKEEKERKNQERIEKIKKTISNMQSDLSGKIQSSTSSASLDGYLKKLNEWSPNPEFYMEFLPDVKSMVEELKKMISQKMDIVKELEKAKSSGDIEAVQEKKYKLEEITQNQQKEQENKQSEIATDDFKARQELISLFTSMGVENVADNVENVIKSYGTAQKAIEHKEDMIRAFNEQGEDNKLNDLKKDKMKNQKVELIFEITNESLVDRQFLKVNEVAIRAYLQKNRDEIIKMIESEKTDILKGIIIKKEYKTILK